MGEPDRTKMKCVKCGWASFKRKRLRLTGSLGFLNPEEVTAYICNRCGYIEFYSA